MKPFFLHHDPKQPKPPSEDHPVVPLHELPRDTSEGSEFLDDAIRLEDEPPNYTEESMAAGSPENLL